MKLLIADNNAFMRRLIRQIVGGHFLEILECENGVDAVQLFKKHQPDWILMDIDMPILDGLTATDIIMKLFPQAKIIILTKYEDESYRRAAQNAGATAFSTKDDLLQILSLIGL